MLVLGGWGWGWCWVGWVLLLSFVQCSGPGCVVSLPLTLWQHGLHAQDSPSLSLSSFSLYIGFHFKSTLQFWTPLFPSLPLFVSVFLLPFSHSLALFQPSPSSSLSLYRLLLVHIFPFPSPLFYLFFLTFINLSIWISRLIYQDLVCIWCCFFFFLLSLFFLRSNCDNGFGLVRMNHFWKFCVIFLNFACFWIMNYNYLGCWSLVVMMRFRLLLPCVRSSNCGVFWVCSVSRCWHVLL